MVFFRVFFRTFGFLSALLVFFSIEGDQNSNNIIGVINLNGPIFNNSRNVLENNFYDYINPEHIRLYLEELKELNIKILLVNINSPGGTVTATAELENILKNFKKETKVKIYFFTSEILASGGYWIATTADKIFASYGSTIGSIGVGGPSWYYYNTPLSLSSGLLGQSIETEKGIEVFNQNAGQSKDLFNPFRKPKDQEILHLQKIVDEIYEDFITKVSKNRKIQIETIRNNIGALIYSSTQAKEKFLIDEVANYRSLIEYIIKENNYDDYKIYENIIKRSLLGNFLASYKDKNGAKFNICNRFEMSINVVTPLFLKEC
jgi:protease-4